MKALPARRHRTSGERLPCGGFTLIEMLVVIVLAGILISVVIDQRRHPIRGRSSCARRNASAS